MVTGLQENIPSNQQQIMNPAETLLKAIVDSSEGTRKSGFTTGGVSFQLNQASDTITATVTIPVSIATSSAGVLQVTARDFLELPVTP
jgi:hypothetical protein